MPSPQSGLDLSFRVVDQFFDRKKVIRAVNAARRKNLSKAGAFVMTSARSSIRPARKIRSRDEKGKYRASKLRASSLPGQPPRYHTRTNPNLRTIFFAWDAASESVLVGPVKFNQVNVTTRGIISVPNLLEFGGTARIAEVSYDKGKTWHRHDKRRSLRPGQNVRVRTAHYKPRPFMFPALEREAPKFPNLWRDSVQSHGRLAA